MSIRTAAFPVSLALAIAAAPCRAEFPERPVRIITSLPGGSSDFTARIIAQGISGPLGQPVIVDNRQSTITAETAMKAPPDGYTLLMEGSSFWFSPLLQKTPYDVLKDFSPVTIATTAPNILVAHPTVGANSVADMIALAKSKPGQLNYSSSGSGGLQHLAMEMLKAMAKVNIVHVPYKGSGAALTGIIGGEVQFMISSAAAAAPLIKAGKLKVLGVTSARPSALVPGAPTIASAGLQGYELEQRVVVFASGQPPRATVVRLNQEIVRALNTPDIKQKFTGAGVETVANTPAEAVAMIKADVSRMGKVIKEAGIKAD